MYQMLRKSLLLLGVILIGMMAGGLTYYWQKNQIVSSAVSPTPSTALAISNSDSFLASDAQKASAIKKITISPAQKNSDDGSLTGTVTNADSVVRIVNLEATYYDQGHSSVSTGFSSLITVAPNQTAPFTIYAIENQANAPTASSFDISVDSIM